MIYCSSRALAGEVFPFEWKSRRPSNGTFFDVEIVFSKIILDGQELILANVQDISDRQRSEGKRKRTEACLKQQAAELEFHWNIRYLQMEFLPRIIRQRQ